MVRVYRNCKTRGGWDALVIEASQEPILVSHYLPSGIHETHAHRKDGTVIGMTDDNFNLLLESKQECATCTFFKHESYSCRRFPPAWRPVTVLNYQSDVLVRDVEAKTAFPQPNPTDWCGEWKEQVNG